MVLQNLAGSADLSDRGYDRGPVKLIQRSKLPHLHDERSDRSRTVWPHIFDVLHADDRRWHLEPNRIGGLEKHLGHQRDHLVGLEILSFLQDSTTDSQNEAGALRELASGARGEVTAGLAVLLLDAPAGNLRRFQSRARQDVHMQVNSALREVGQIGMDRSGDAMHASELPFIVTAAVDDDDVPDLVAVAGRELDGCLVLDVASWKIAIWQDLVAMAASCAVPRATYWPRDRSPEVALASVGDVCLMRLLQRYALHTLATRVGSAQPGTALKLQSAAHPIRSRLWWSGLSGDPLAAAVADRLAEAWDLHELADETFTGLEVLARRDALDESRKQSQEAVLQTRQATELSDQATRLNRLLFYFAIASLMLAFMTFLVDLLSDSVDGRTRLIVTLIALGLVLVSAAATGLLRAASRQKAAATRASQGRPIG